MKLPVKLLGYACKTIRLPENEPLIHSLPRRPRASEGVFLLLRVGRLNVRRIDQNASPALAPVLPTHGRPRVNGWRNSCAPQGRNGRSLLKRNLELGSEIEKDNNDHVLDQFR